MVNYNPRSPLNFEKLISIRSNENNNTTKTNKPQKAISIIKNS